MTCPVCDLDLNGALERCNNCSRQLHKQCFKSWYGTSTLCPACGGPLGARTKVTATVFAVVSESFTVYAKDMGGKLHTFTVNPTHTVWDLKVAVGNKTGDSASKLRLVFEGRPLNNDSEKLVECLRDGAEVTVTLRAPGGSVETRKRIIQEQRKMQISQPPGIFAKPTESDLFTWTGMIVGPSNTAWAGGTFPIVITFTAEYPQKPPQVKFTGEMFHPNVFTSGVVCSGILDAKKEYRSDLTLGALLLAVQALLPEPNTTDPANGEANQMFLKDIVKYHKKVRQCVEKSG